jgi:hypothetical protein
MPQRSRDLQTGARLLRRSRAPAQQSVGDPHGREAEVGLTLRSTFKPIAGAGRAIRFYSPAAVILTQH